MWIWMIIAGLGIGPSFAVFTLIVQNSVPPREVGTASSSLTFFQQIGGTVGLTIASTIFASRLIEEIPPQLVAAGVPQQFIDQFQAQGQRPGAQPHGNWRPGHANPGPGAGSVQGARRAAATADRGRHPRSVLTGCGIDVLDRHRRSSLAALAVLFLKEIPMRSTFEMSPEAPEVKTAEELSRLQAKAPRPAESRAAGSMPARVELSVRSGAGT